ncbi:MAG: hypothetical protein GY913_22500 [Proteobacteria bacterium]|nr:hypothetical protein [Pseudomonadota bacterium]MCP4919681.1 hypothetical protein [Pseudomonadota bacterium]
MWNLLACSPVVERAPDAEIPTWVHDAPIEASLFVGGDRSLVPGVTDVEEALAGAGVQLADDAGLVGGRQGLLAVQTASIAPEVLHDGGPFRISAVSDDRVGLARDGAPRVQVRRADDWQLVGDIAAVQRWADPERRALEFDVDGLVPAGDVWALVRPRRFPQDLTTRLAEERSAEARVLADGLQRLWSDSGHLLASVQTVAVSWDGTLHVRATCFEPCTDADVRDARLAVLALRTEETLPESWRAALADLHLARLDEHIEGAFSH